MTPEIVKLLILVRLVPIARWNLDFGTSGNQSDGDVRVGGAMSSVFKREEAVISFYHFLSVFPCRVIYTSSKDCNLSPPIPRREVKKFLLRKPTILTHCIIFHNLFPMNSIWGFSSYSPLDNNSRFQFDV